MRTLLVAVVAVLVTTALAPAASTAAPADAAPSGSATVTALVIARAPIATARVAGRAECRRTLPRYPVIEPETTSRAVRTLQCVLDDAGYGPLSVDGYYGPQTKAAVRRFTDLLECCPANRLRVRTWYWTILFSQSHRLRGLELGDTGIRVKTLQRALRADGETLVVDGDFGRQTRAQVRVFQEKCGIKVTGRVDDQTSFFFSQGGCNDDNAS